MKLLNAQVALHPALRSYPAPRERLDITLKDRQFVYDSNSMALWECTSKDEAIPLSARKPQFPRSLVQPRSLVLEATNDCNFACKYCFAREYAHSRQNMPPSIAVQAITQLLGHAKADKLKYNIGFFGGEPLMNWGLIESTVPFAHGYFNRRASFGITTNGSLLDAARAKFLVENGFSFILSLDGPKELHDEFRVHKSGAGTFEQTYKGLTCVKEAGGANRTTLRSTYVPGHVHLLDRAVYLNELCDNGFAGGVAVEPVCITESHCIQSEMRGFDAETAKALEPDYMAIADWAIERLKAGKAFRFRNITAIMERLLYTQHNATECGAGIAYLSVDWQGDLYACHRMNFTRIGSLRDGGIEEELRAPWCEARLYRSRECKCCPERYCCGSGCREANLGANHDINKPHTFYCEMMRLFMRASIWIMANVDTEILVKAFPNTKAPRRPCGTACDEPATLACKETGGTGPTG